ncbi:MAG: hypothetical protein ACREAW_10100 [Nitrososphaera sp.]
MRQIKVFRCDICHAPFLFENNLEDHKKEHALKDVSSAPVEKPAGNPVDKKRRKSTKAKRKRASAS